MIKCIDYVRVDKSISENLDAFTLIESQASESFYSLDRGKSNVVEIIEILHKAFNKDNVAFVKEILYEYQVTMRKIRLPQEKVVSDFDPLISKEYDKYTPINLVNLYRAIISDLFDPYISLIVACIEFEQNDFDSFLSSNLGLGESKKIKYIVSKLKDTKLFYGYEPLVRNAISHSGTDSIIYHSDSVVFRDIRRKRNPLATRYIEWTHDELVERIKQLLDFIHAIDVAVNIFGLDIGKFIQENDDLSKSFLERLVTPESKEEWSNNFSLKICEIWDSDDLAENVKVNTIAKMFFIECEKRSMPIKNLGFKDGFQTVIFDVPASGEDYNNDDNVISTSLKLLRYGIIAEPFFRQVATDYVVREVDEIPALAKLIVKSQGENLRLYGIEQAGLYDLLAEGSIYLNNKLIPLSIDFELLEEQEKLSLDRLFPRKKRKP